FPESERKVLPQTGGRLVVDRISVPVLERVLRHEHLSHAVEVHHEWAISGHLQEVPFRLGLGVTKAPHVMGLERVLRDVHWDRRCDPPAEPPLRAVARVQISGRLRGELTENPIMRVLALLTNTVPASPSSPPSATTTADSGHGSHLSAAPRCRGTSNALR